MACTSCSLDDIINFIVNKYKINRESATSTFYKLRNAVKNKLTCGDYVCNRKILKTFIKNNRFYKFFNNLSDCYLDLIIDNVLESCVIDITEPEPDPIPGLRLTYLNGEFPESDLAGWNTKFDLPSFGTAFTDMVVEGDEVTLIGGAGITLRAGLFRTNDKLLKIEDDVDCVVAIGGGRNLGALSLCSALTTVTLNGVITVAEEGLLNNPLLTSLSLNDCTTIGGNGLAFNDAIATLTLPSVTSIGNGGMLGLSALTTFSSSTLLTAGINAFNLNTNLVSLNLPNLTTLGNNAMFSCVSVTLINIPLCVNLGTDPSDAYVFDQILGQTLTLNIAAVNATNNAGGVHASIAYLIANNSATVNYI